MIRPPHPNQLPDQVPGTWWARPSATRPNQVPGTWWARPSARWPRVRGLILVTGLLIQGSGSKGRRTAHLRTPSVLRALPHILHVSGTLWAPAFVRMPGGLSLRAAAARTRDLLQGVLQAFLQVPGTWWARMATAWALGLCACATVPSGGAPGSGAVGRTGEPLGAGADAAGPRGSRTCGGRWALWETYADRFLSDDGRVIDRTDGDRTTSEGQAYGLFFALVANDRARFDRLLRWTRDNLAAGDLTRRLPAWLWGRDEDGRWHVLDENPASDADLWIAYTLVEAARLWEAPALDRIGRRVAAQIVEREVTTLPGLGPMLLPGPEGFVLEPDHLWRLNPSYLPLPVLRGLAAARVPGPWTAVANSAVRMLHEGSPRGFAPDWIAWRRGRGFVTDPVTGPVGSYDAIRTYLWAGMMPAGDPAGGLLAAALAGPYRHFLAHGRVPEQVDVRRGAPLGGRVGPPGFFAALLPEATRRGDEATAARLIARLVAAKHDGLYGDPPTYYDQNLILFATGFRDRWYRFDDDGRLRPRWAAACAP